MDRLGFGENLAALKEELGRLQTLRRQIDAAAARTEMPADAAQVGERIRCSLQIAIASLERDTAFLDSQLKATGSGRTVH